MESTGAQILAQTSEAPTETTETTENQAQDPRLDVIARADKRMRQEREELKRLQQELEEKRNKYKSWEEDEELFQKNPLDVLKKRGWDFEKLSEFAVKHTPEEDLDPVAKKFKEYDSRIEKTKEELRQEYEAKIKEREEYYNKQAMEQEQKAFKASIKSVIAENKADFELISAQDNGADLIYEVIEADFLKQQQSGVSGDQLKIMDVKDAATRVEKYLETQLDGQLQKYLTLNKFKSKLNPEKADWMGQLKESQQSKTLTNSATAKSPQSPSELSMEQRLKLATEMLEKGMFNKE